MEFASKVKVLRDGRTPEFPAEANSLEYARSLDKQDRLSHLREQFIIPTKGSLRKKALDGTIPGE
jgi:kynureninase